MEDLEEVRKRMQNKKQAQVLTNRSFDKFYHFAIGTMSICAILLMAFCFIKTNPNADVLSYIDKHILTLLPTFDFQKDKMVSENFFYEQLDSHTFVGNDQHIYALENGIVKEVKDDTIIIMYQNGVTASYSNVATSHVQSFDRISANESIGTYEQTFTMVLYKNGQEVAYDEIFA